MITSRLQSPDVREEYILKKFKLVERERVRERRAQRAASGGRRSAGARQCGRVCNTTTTLVTNMYACMHKGITVNAVLSPATHHAIPGGIARFLLPSLLCARCTHRVSVVVAQVQVGGEGRDVHVDLHAAALLLVLQRGRAEREAARVLLQQRQLVVARRVVRVRVRVVRVALAAAALRRHVAEHDGVAGRGREGLDSLWQLATLWHF